MANVLVAYASRLGGTRGIAEAIGVDLERRGHNVSVQSVNDVANVEPFDAVVLGSGVFANHWHKPAVAFVQKHERALHDRAVWLFSSGPVGNIKPSSRLADPAEVAELRSRLQPRDHRIFWGRLDRTRLDGSDLSSIMKAIARRFMPEGDWRDWAAIDAWAETISTTLGAPVSVAL